MFLIGGSGASNLVGNDGWTWDASKLYIYEPTSSPTCTKLKARIKKSCTYMINPILKMYRFFFRERLIDEQYI
jgi:hypothetical protein